MKNNIKYYFCNHEYNIPRTIYDCNENINCALVGLLHMALIEILLQSGLLERIIDIFQYIKLISINVYKMKISKYS